MAEINDNGGFTLIEMMFVLMVISVMIGIVMINMVPYSKHVQIEHFLHQFKKDMYYAKEYAISHEEQIAVYINLTTEVKTYQIVESDTFHVLLVRPIPDNITLDTGTMGASFRYLQNGNVSKAGKVFLTAELSRYELVFTLGRGIIVERKL